MLEVAPRKIFFQGDKRDVAVWGVIAVIIFVFAMFNLAVISLFGQQLGKNTGIFQDFLDVPVIERALEKLPAHHKGNNELIASRSNRIEAAYGFTLLFGTYGGGLLLLVETCFYLWRFFAIRPKPADATREEIDALFKNVVKLTLIILPSSLFLLWLEIYYGNLGNDFYDNKVYSRDIDLYRYPLFMWLSIFGLSLAILATYMAAMLFSIRRKYAVS